MIYNCSHFNPINISTSSTEQMAFASSSCELANPTSSVPAVYNGFTNGEIIISLFLFLMFMGLLFQFFIWIFFGVRVKKIVKL